MTILEAMEKRHSVRSYTDQKIEGKVLQELQSYIAECNKEGGMHIQLCLNEPEAFSGRMARYGSFNNVNNYLAIVGKKGKYFDELCGYWGEKVVLKAQQLGLSTCWVALTYSKNKEAYQVKEGEKFCCVIAIGYGETQGVPHKNKPLESLCDVRGTMPTWFKKGMDAALLAPTATNQQKFKISLEDTVVSAKAGLGFYAKLDLGIVRCHFEIGAEEGKWEWEEGWLEGGIRSDYKA